MPAPTILDPSSLPITPPMDLTAALPGDPISPTPLRLRSNRGVGLFGLRRGSGSLIRTHKGVDLLAPAGQAVFATSQGIVVQVNNAADAKAPPDFFVTVHHQPFELAWVSSYRHLASRPIVVRGQQVDSGQQLGQVATDHLHFEVRQIFNEALLSEYLTIYRAVPTLPDPVDPTKTIVFDFSSVSSNIGNTGHSLALDPTRVLYDWENKMYRNDSTARQGHLLDGVVISNFEEVWRDRMRFVLVNVQGDGRDFFVPLLRANDPELSLIQTLRHGFFARSRIRLVWRDSLFFSQIQANPFANIVAEVTVRT